MKNGDTPAFARSAAVSEGVPQDEGAPGITKREYFAGLALAGLLAHATQVDSKFIVATAVGMADQLLAELGPPPT